MQSKKASSRPVVSEIPISELCRQASQALSSFHRQMRLLLHPDRPQIGRRLAQSGALRFSSRCGILPLPCLSPDAISHQASYSLSLPVCIVA
jgi:hypothetical protein